MSRWDLSCPQLDMTRSCVTGWGSALTYFRSIPPEVGQCRPSLHQNCWRLAKKGKLPAVCWKSLTSGWSVFLEKIKKSDFLSSWALPGALNPRKRKYSFLEFFGLVERRGILFPSPYSNFHSFVGITNFSEIQPFTPLLFFYLQNLLICTPAGLIITTSKQSVLLTYYFLFGNTNNNKHPL